MSYWIQDTIDEFGSDDPLEIQGDPNEPSFEDFTDASDDMKALFDNYDEELDDVSGASDFSD
tara:strand:- start:64 stop:249 length:186 start_codon:yes stop_codon:yes gene_type:complete